MMVVEPINIMLEAGAEVPSLGRVNGGTSRPANRHRILTTARCSFCWARKCADEVANFAIAERD